MGNAESGRAMLTLSRPFYPARSSHRPHYSSRTRWTSLHHCVVVVDHFVGIYLASHLFFACSSLTGVRITNILSYSALEGA